MFKFVQSLRKNRKSSSGSRQGFGGPKKEPSRKLKTFKQERTSRPPLRHQYQQQQPQQHHYQEQQLPTAAQVDSHGLQACDSLLSSLLNLQQHCDFVRPFMYVDAELQYDGETPLSLSRFDNLTFRKTNLQLLKMFIIVFTE